MVKQSLPPTFSETRATPQSPPVRVTVRRILLEWSHADDEPPAVDELDTLVMRAVTVRYRHP